MSLKKELKSLLSEAKIDEVLDLILNTEKGKPFNQVELNEAVLISGSFRQMIKNEKSGEILTEDAYKQRNQIVFRLLDLIDKIDESQSSNSKSKDNQKEKKIHLRSSHEFDPFEDVAKDAKELYIFSANAINLFGKNDKFFEKKLKSFELESFRFLILEKTSSGFKAWSKISSKFTKPKERIKTSMEFLIPILKERKHGFTEIRKWKLTMPYNAVHVVLPDEEILFVQFYTYNFSQETKPHVVMSRKDNPKFFNRFKEEIEWAWREAEKDVYPLEI